MSGGRPILVQSLPWVGSGHGRLLMRPFRRTGPDRWAICVPSGMKWHFRQTGKLGGERRLGSPARFVVVEQPEERRAALFPEPQEKKTRRKRLKGRQRPNRLLRAATPK